MKNIVVEVIYTPFSFFYFLIQRHYSGMRMKRHCNYVKVNNTNSQKQEWTQKSLLLIQTGDVVVHAVGLTTPLYGTNHGIIEQVLNALPQDFVHNI